jgi:chromosome segregation ATPase
MTDNQFKQLFSLVTNCVNSIQDLRGDVSELKGDVSELKSDVSELKQGQQRLEKEMKLLGKSVSYLHSDMLNIRARVEVLEEERNISN